MFLYKLRVLSSKETVTARVELSQMDNVEKITNFVIKFICGHFRLLRSSATGNAQKSEKRVLFYNYRAITEY